jgi:hypothetical protein
MKCPPTGILGCPLSRGGRVFRWIVLVAVVVLGALAWWSSGRQRGVNHAAIGRTRKIDEGRSSRPG